MLLVFVLSVSALTTGCMKNTTPGTPTSNSPNIGVVVSLETAAAACNVTSVMVTGPVAGILSGPCVTTMSGILNIVEANGTPAQIQALINTLQADVKALPPGTQYLNYAAAAIQLAQDALNTYMAATDQTLNTASTTPTGANAFFAGSDNKKPKKIKWTKAEHDRIEAAKAKLGKGGKN